MNRPAILVTGASRGLGAATARIAAGRGASVVLSARTQDELQSQVQWIEQTGGQALAVPGDVSREVDCRNLVQQAVEHFGRIDALVNNAGAIEPIDPLAEADAEAWERNWAVNVLGPVLLVREALPYLREMHGRVVNISSGAAENLVGGWGAYSAAKAALNHLTRILAREEPGITALALRPGIVDTEMQTTIREKGKNNMAESNYGYLYGLFEQGRLLPPEKPARAIACLALYAPQAWSGEILQWDEARVQALVEERG